MEIQLLNIEQKISLKVHLNEKLNIIGKFGHALDIVGKPWMSRI
jgi:hypothetical protein